MRIATPFKNYLFYFILLFSLLGINNKLYAQCPTVVKSIQSFCDVQSSRVADLQATDNGSGVKWYDKAVGGNLFNSGDLLVNNKIYYADDTTGACGVRASVTVQIYSKPSIPFSGITFCQSSTINDLSPYVTTNHNGPLRWYSSQFLGSILDPSTSLINNTTYWVSQLNPDTGCESSRRGLAVTLTIVPTPIGNTIQDFCSTPLPLVADLVASGTGILWYDSSGNLLSSTKVLEDGHYYYAESNVGNCSSDVRLEILAHVNQPNKAGTSSNKKICESQISLTAPFDLFGLLGGNPDKTGLWTGSIPTINGFQGTLDVAPLTLSGSPYVFTYTVSSASCPTVSTTVTINILSNPTVTVNSPTVCSGTPAPVTATPIPSGTYNYAWTIPSGATPPGNTGSFSTNTAGTYTVTITDTTTNCSSTSGSGLVTINPLANAGNDASLNICTNQNPIKLFGLLGEEAQVGGTWSPVLVSETGMFNPAVDASGDYIYTVKGIAPCVDASAKVTVTVTSGPEAGASNTLELCVNSASQNLFSVLGSTAQLGGVWTNPSGTVVSNIFNPATDMSGNYKYSFSGPNPCDNDFAIITVTVNPIPNAGTNGSKVFCSNGSPANLSNALGGAPQLGGVWSPVLTSNSGLFDPSKDVPQVYTYTVGGNLCVKATATVAVTVIQAPNSGGIGKTLNTCPNINSVDLFTGLDGTQDLGGTWSDDDGTGAVVTNIFNPSIIGLGTYHFTYTVLGNAPCSNASSTVTVVVNPLPKAGVFTSISPVCASVGNINLNDLLTGEDSNGTWTVSSPIDISNFSDGTYTYTYSVTNSCGVDTEEVQFTVLPNPKLNSVNISCAPVCIASDVVLNFSGMYDGSYTLNYDVFGSNLLLNQNSTITVIGGKANFTLPAILLPNVGTSTITFNTIQNTVTACKVILSDVNATIKVNPVVQIDNSNIHVVSVCLGTEVTVNIANAVNLPDGNYQFNYTIPTGNPSTGNSGNVIVSGGNGQFIIPASVFGTVGNYSLTITSIISATGCSNMNEDAGSIFDVITLPKAGTFIGVASVCSSVGTFDLATLLTGQDAGGIWTDSNSQIVISPINIANFTAGTYTYTYTVNNACGVASKTVQFTVLANGQLNTSNLNVLPVCVNSNAIVNFTNMVDGTYTLNYDLSGSNVLTNQQVIITIASGIGSFTIPSTLIPNTGSTVISFINIVNNITTCSNVLANVTTELIIKSLLDIDNTNLSIANNCIGNNTIVKISNAGNLPDGDYQFNYAISGANTGTGNSGNVTITFGSGQFSIPSSALTLAGDTTLVIDEIISTTGCSNLNENATANFTIYPLPSLVSASISAPSSCMNFSNLVTISGANNLANGDYAITYQLTGANNATATVTVTFNSGVALFTIPANNLNNVGDTTITINQLVSIVSNCGISGDVISSFTFNVSSLATPELIENGNQFCQKNNPTIADLSANIVDVLSVIWYSEATEGTVFNKTDLLIEGTTYYAALVSSSGCESAIRLAVTVDLIVCDDLVIPDGFSPNGDGINDTFEIEGLDVQYSNFKMEVYNRYGNLVYEGDKNTSSWDGTTSVGGLKIGNNILPNGVYFYILTFNDGIKKAVQGRVYLNR